MTLQPDGTVVMWPATCGCVPGAELNGGQHARVWNPTTNVFTLHPCESNVFCSAHAPLADGRTLVVGGHVDFFEGLRDTNIFNSDRTWTRVGNMAQPRWYPSAVRLADGRVLAISGNTTGQNAFADVPEVFNPDPMVNAWTSLTAAPMRIPAYPFLFVVPGGTVVVAGPDRITRRLNVGTQTWTTIGDSFITAHSAVQYRPGRIMKSGTFGNIDDGVPGVDARTVVLDTTVASPAWRETPPMANPRAFHTLTLLPDGTVLVTGGNRSGGGQDTSSAVDSAEVWDPATETWRTLASAQRPRLYHSTALLLPDGRVVSAGGEFAPYLQENAEFFSPPYLFAGARPTITSVPATPIGYGNDFTIQTPSSVARVTLLAPASVTHGINMNQRFLELTFTPVAGGVSARAPASADLAPPGFYMVFVLNGAGVPSVGRFIQILPGGAGTTTTTLTPPPSTTTSSTTAVPSTTSTSAAPAPSTTSTTATTPTTTSSTTSTLPPAAGLAAAYAFDEGAGSTAADASGNANVGTLAGPAWLAPGRFGGSSLVFDGTGVHVAIPDRPNLDLTELTLEAWVFPTATAGYRVIIAKTTTGQPVNYYFAIQDGVLNFGFLNGGGWREHRSAVGPALNTWSHVAAAFSDSANQVRLYLNGTQVLSATETTSPQTNAEQLRIGVGFSNEGFTGRIDEVRVYNRALSTPEIGADVNRPVGAAGTTSTSTSSSTSSSSSSSSSTSAPPPSTTSTSRTTTSSTSTSIGTSSTSTSTSSTSSTSAPTPSTTSTSAPAPSTSTTSTTSSSTSTSAASSSSSSSTTSTSSSSSSTTPPPPTTSTTATPTTSTTTSTSAVPSGLVAAYGFEEAAGNTVIDASGNGRTGTITGATRTTAGQFGRALSFDGINDRISIGDAASLDLTAGVTLEAWVNPTNVGGYRTIVAKTTNGTPNNYYLALNDGAPNFGFFNSDWREHQAGASLPLNTWSHVAATYSDAAKQVRLYVNGVEVLSATETASLVTNSAQLRIGVGFPNEDFAGRIDELRVYDRALSAAEIQADRLRAVP